VAGVYYFTGINDLTVKGFKLQTAKQKINSLNEENKVMAQKATSLESYSSLSERVKTLSMVAVGSVDYITAESGIVAKK
jgi:cell shape-determining protein MreC